MGRGRARRGDQEGPADGQEHGAEQERERVEAMTFHDRQPPCFPGVDSRSTSIEPIPTCSTIRMGSGPGVSREPDAPTPPRGSEPSIRTSPIPEVPVIATGVHRSTRIWITPTPRSTLTGSAFGPACRLVRSKCIFPPDWTYWVARAEGALGRMYRLAH